MAAMAELLVAAGACIAIALVVVPWALRQRSAESPAVVAARHHLSYSAVDPFGSTRVAFPLFRKGDGRRFGFFVKGRWVLLVSDPVPPETVPALMRVTEAFVDHIPRVVYELWPSPFRGADGRPLPAGDEEYGLAVTRAEQHEHDPWSAPRAGSREGAVPEDRPEYDLDGNVVREQPEDPWT